MKKVLVVCGNGLGSSMIVEMNVNAILKDMGKDANVSHTDLATAKTEQADIFLGSEDIVDSLDDGHKNVIKLKNLMDKGELREALEKHF
ncbi:MULTISPECIES: PTS sugar transporter subunit IIB [Virgibacillus]|uniref:Ascorbate-specific phosphotransferase enzyme IIB component n=2 Tax=Virgibacillus TaxID=84406 RepID=A0A024QE45_9BACI|nr:MULTISPECIES: PTS sugar transporter subunit IIB [Virgibacillus]EQB36769.1 PTS lactose transporter subunit IIB [Virgibacillus sp. CM-4]MYL42595.1 PTS lactose transporter subunit IIB [Virgibacillus massiliensis]GGJ73803.1 PTS ascorbate transporter subunit IIB [Virgibacillus kapii]CDQ40477.1 Ascorbate-specific phosphotransferase enzyme IIB component [Virgibacillus massiliensis]